MIQPGDRIAVGVSGGKDSLILLMALAKLKKFYPVPFTLEAITLDPGTEDLAQGNDFGPVQRLCQDLDVPYTVIPTQIRWVIFNARQEKNPCALCSKMRRGALHMAIQDRGIRKIALGHHYDDAIETFYMSLIFEGRLSCFQPVTYLDRTGITQIRPLLYCGESLIRRTAQRLELPVVRSTCPVDGSTKRQEIKELIYELQGRYPGLKAQTFGAMQRLPLPAWGPVEHRRRPLPEDSEE
ncbi:MAG: tRNA 2-thiocytidine biosynthesis protein TtcA [Lawsonibacter sp.]|nr:tRNA 2-thiocytidine biosynthesis protein TtcA [Lawsonibacter sp.]